MVIAERSRWLALANGTFHAIVGLPIVGVLSFPLCLPIIIGALISKRSAVWCKCLLWFGAGVISLVALPVDVGILFLVPRGGTDPRVTATVVTSLVLVFWCDAALAAGIVRQRHRPRAERQAPDKPGYRRSGFVPKTRCGPIMRTYPHRARGRGRSWAAPPRFRRSGKARIRPQIWANHLVGRG